MLATLRYIHASPKSAGVRKGFPNPHSNDGHDEGLVAALTQDWQQGAEHFRRVNGSRSWGRKRPEWLDDEDPWHQDQ